MRNHFARLSSTISAIFILTLSISGGTSFASAAAAEIPSGYVLAENGADPLPGEQPQSTATNTSVYLALVRANEIIADPPTMAESAKIDGHSYHTCAVTESGGVKCWGYNDNGRLGDGTMTDRHKPVDVFGLKSGMVAVTTGEEFTCALSEVGGVKCWGDNFEGKLGDGTTIDRYTPVDVVGLGSGVTAITAGNYHICALMTSGIVKCWGSNMVGQIGDILASEVHTPIEVPGLDGRMISIAAGTGHTCALTSNGAVKCWGRNDEGQLGNGTNTASRTPVDVIGLNQGVTAIAAFGLNTCAITLSGGIRCWGWNRWGQIGDGTTVSRGVPVDVISLSTGVKAIATGGATCALTQNGGMKCWGHNDRGSLGDGTTNDRATPGDVVGLSSGVVGISVGGAVCGRQEDGDLKCWGYNKYGQVGDGTTTNRTTPVNVRGG